MPELVTDGMRLNMIARRKTDPLRTLGPRQIAWCEQNLRGFAWPRVQRLAKHADAARSETGVG